MGTNMSEDHPLKGLQITSSTAEFGVSSVESNPEANTPISAQNLQSAFTDIQNTPNSNDCDNSNILSNNEHSFKSNYIKNGSNINCDGFKLYSFDKETEISERVSKDHMKLDSALGLDQDVRSQFNISHSLSSSVEKNENDLVSDFEDNKPDMVSADSEDSALGSLPCEPPLLQEGEDEPQDRSDGSDSGLGSEIAEDQITQQPFTDIPPVETKLLDESLTVDGTNFDTFEILNNNSESINRKLEDPLSLSQFTDVATFSTDVSVINSESLRFKSNLKRKHDMDNCEVPKIKKRKTLTFDDVTVYYFPRSQGFTCIPSQGGSTLGMANQHTHIQKFTLPEHNTEQRRLHRQILQQLRSERHSVQGSSVSSSDYSDSEDEPSEISESELDLDSYYFLQPVPTRQRRALLRAAGVRKIEAMEKDECRDIRTSRELCGCSCKGYCDPETCSCSQNGIKCQVDRLNFPCGCTRDGCGNTTGRIEFNPVRVRTHFIHTLMRLGLEKKAEENASKSGAANEHTQWPSTKNRLLSTPSSSYQGDSINCESPGVNKYSGNLLRDVNLSSHVEVESCVNAGTFNNMHYDLRNQTKSVSNLQCREDSLDLYTFREDCYNEGSRVTNLTPNSNTPNQQIEPFSLNISKEKVSNYAHPNHVSYPGTPSLRFPCEMAFPCPSHPESGHYSDHQQYSAASFEDFSQQSHNVYNHYNSMYINEYSSKQAQDQNPNIAEFPNIQATGSYGGYRAGENCFPQESKETNQYTNLHSPAYPLSNKLESFSELMQGKYTYNSYESSMGVSAPPLGPGVEQVASVQQVAPPPPTPVLVHQESSPDTLHQPPPVANSSESDENFGEIIKKTMVETVST